MKYLLQHISLPRFLNLGPYENDPGFRELLVAVCRRGMFIAGLLGTVAVLIYVISHILIVNKTIVWTYSEINPGSEIALWDKGLILIFSMGCIFFLRGTVTLTRARLLVAIVVWTLSIAMLLDDIGVRDVSASPAYISFALILAVGTMPYKGWQTGLLNLVVILSALGTVLWIPALMSLPPIPLLPSQVIYLFLFALLMTGLSSQLYLNRYDQYRSRRLAEELGAELEERARRLEKMKEKSDRQAKEILEHEKRKDRFFANISHEFRTPLTLILGPLNDLLRETDGERATVHTPVLQKMYYHGRQLLTMVNRLLDLSKIDAGRIELDIKKTNIVSLIERSVLSFTPMAEQHGVELDFIPPGDRVTVAVDLEQFQSVLGNLLSNAIKFTPDGGKVSVTLTANESSTGIVRVNVLDTGKGISQEELPHIFDRFYQSASNTGTGMRGTGIGLALVKEIVELHGGEVGVESIQGTGTEFTITLDTPVTAKQVAAEDGAPKPAPLDGFVAGKKRTVTEETMNYERAEDAPSVILVDDNADILAYLHSFLSMRYNVSSFERSDKALDYLRNEGGDLVISDVLMPDPDGFELCRILKESPGLKDIPIILLTARAGGEHKLEGLEQGADDYINKPFSASELMARVENLIDLRRILRNKYSEEVHIKGKNIEVDSDDARFLKQVQEVIDRHMEDSNFSVDWLADEVNLSSRQLQRKIHSITDLSAGGYIRMLRLERARQLLEQDWGNVSEISYKIGFRDPKYFSKLFKQTFGTTPSEFAGQAPDY